MSRVGLRVVNNGIIKNMAKKQRMIVIGNWKLNPPTLKEAESIFTGIKNGIKDIDVKVVICPPFVYLNELRGLSTKEKIFLGSQDISSESKGAFTGEISAEMLKNVGATYTIIGHSERRAKGETDADVAKKVAVALKAGLTTIVCIGEKERDERGSYLGFLKEQIVGSLKGVPRKFASNIIIAYEPVWAIGKGKEAVTAHDLHQMTIFIRKHLIDIYNTAAASEISIIYGGSVDEENAELLIADGEVDGLLVGRESLNPENFVKIVKVVEK